MNKQIEEKKRKKMNVTQMKKKVESLLIKQGLHKRKKGEK